VETPQLPRHRRHLVLSVVERTRARLLRAVGATRHQVAAIVEYESMLMAALGSAPSSGEGAPRCADAVETTGVSTSRVD